MCSVTTKPKELMMWEPGSRYFNMKKDKGKSQNNGQGESRDHKEPRGHQYRLGRRVEVVRSNVPK